MTRGERILFDMSIAALLVGFILASCASGPPAEPTWPPIEHINPVTGERSR